MPKIVLINPVVEDGHGIITKKRGSMEHGTYNVDDAEHNASCAPHGQESAVVVVSHVVLDSGGLQIFPHLCV